MNDHVPCERITISIPAGLREKADQMIEAEAFAHVSSFVQSLIRRRWQEFLTEREAHKQRQDCILEAADQIRAERARETEARARQAKVAK